MAVESDRAAQITSAVAFGAKKSDFTGPLSPEEDAYWDKVAAEVAENGPEGIDMPDLELPDIAAVYDFYPAGFFGE